MTTEEILAKNEIFSYLEFIQTNLVIFSVKKVWWPNRLSQYYEILHEKTVDHMLSNSLYQNLSKQIFQAK